ncbi:MAG: chemotaxis protein CheA [Thermodesulfobacteriota bacterium]
MADAISEVSIFREESLELLADIEATLLELEENPDSRPLVDRLFRAMHTIKGSGAMFGFDAIAAFAHKVETAIDAVRSGRISISRPLVELVLASRDVITTMIDGIEEGAAASPVDTGPVIAGLEALLAERGASAPAPAPAAAAKDLSSARAAPAAGPSRLFRIRFRPDPECLRRNLDPLTLLRDLAALGSLRCTALVDQVPGLTELDPERSYLGYDILLTTGADENAIRDVFIFLEKDSALAVTHLPDPHHASEEEPPRLGEILVDRGDVQPGQVEAVLRAKPRLGETLVEAGVVSAVKVKAALAEQQVVRERRQTTQASTIRVASDKLDFLVNIVGELVTAQARLEESSSRVQGLDLMGAVEEVGRLVTELRDKVMGIRMLPIGVTFDKFRRLVRDLAVSTGKKVELRIEGGETELDKSMIEKLNDPLVHLIRNAVDHGIEPPEVRRQAGKPETGTITLSASHIGGQVRIRITDDGGGIDAGAVAAKAVAQGLVREMDLETMSWEERLALIFHPGLSTARQVTNVSGRGVGMDVVRTEIGKLRGRLELASTPGQGSAIDLKLPLTMAIIDGLLVRALDTRYVIPVSSIKECLELTDREIEAAHGRQMIKVRDTVIPYVRLRQLFDGADRDQEIEQVIIVEHESSSVGLVIDQIYGDCQTVIKSLGKAFADAQGISGATILGDGTVALIVDVPQLITLALAEERQRVGHRAERPH